MNKILFLKTYHNIFKILSLFLIVSCSKNDLPDFNKLETIRIIAFQVSAPEVNPGATVSVTPLISDITATSLNYTAQTCLDAGISVGAEPTCENNPTKQVIVAQTALTLPGSAENWTGLANSFSVTVPSTAIIFAGKTAVEQYNGVSFIIEYFLTNNLGSTTKSIKRIIVSDPAKVIKNSNPNLSQIYADGLIMTTLTLNSKISLSTDLSAASAETYTTFLSDGTSVAKVESLAVTWFITDGKTKYYRSEGLGSNEYTTANEAPAGRSAYVIAVARDDRGGISIVKKKF
ncbi:MAG: hypothetical protein WA160_03830 [Pseudobdellovibrio sp.]